MEYKINKTNYCDFSIFEDNKLEARSYFIPYINRKEASKVSLKEKRYRSSKVICLNGKWDFKFYPIPKDVPDILNTDKTVFDKIEVPSCWQFNGYDKPFYVNTRYQFPFKPPYIPEEKEVGRVYSWVGFDQHLSLRNKKPKDQYNYVGIYRHYFNVDDCKKNHIISFLGVASCLDLYINGEYVGYSEGSHNTAEFDISKYIRDGKNELVAVVHRWCNGTYLECQDMFRNNGIFRDVLLRVNEPSDIFDIDVKTVKVNKRYNLKVRVKTFSDTEVNVSIEGFGIVNKSSIKTTDNEAEFNFTGLAVKTWNAEEPNLYDLYIETPTCAVKEGIGFKDVKIVGDKFYINDSLVKFHGVNHHDTSPTNGYTMTPDEIEKEILLCKEYNIDMIRTSHYPPDPYLLELADYHGIYIVDENDLETHGVWSMSFPPSVHGYHKISHDSRWESHYLDRIKRLYQRDKIHGNTSIVMWSLGNEAGGYRNMDKMYEYLKSVSSLPVHYESVIHCKRTAYDVGSEMYPSVEKVELVGEHKRKQTLLNDRPYFLCEYAHAMGVGPGNMEAYWEKIYKYDNLIGGCVWEMVDHAVKEKDGSYTYGGDHQEWEHDGNFCVDGIFYPDRKPSTGAYIVKYIYRPLRVRHIIDDEFEIFNTRSFLNGSEYVLRFTFNDGTEADYICDVTPLNKKSLRVKMGKEIDGNLSVIITTLDKNKKFVYSQEQIVIRENILKMSANKGLFNAFRMDKGKVIIALNNGEFLTSNKEYNILYRAGTDNDLDLFFNHSLAPYYRQKEKAHNVINIPHGVMVKYEVKNKKNKYIITDTYEGCVEGVIVTSKIHPVRKKGEIIRFGKCFYLPSSFDDVRYIGRSGESYNDMKDQFVIKENKMKVIDMVEENIRPQESGNRTDVSEVSISNKNNTVTFLALDKPFEIGIKPYSDRELLKMRHRNDEVRSGTYVTIEAFQKGIGTGSCGPRTAKEYSYPADRDYEFRFLIKIN